MNSSIPDPEPQDGQTRPMCGQMWMYQEGFVTDEMTHLCVPRIGAWNSVDEPDVVVCPPPDDVPQDTRAYVFATGFQKTFVACLHRTIGFSAAPRYALAP